MKKIKNKKRFKIIDTNKQILWAIISMFIVIGGALGLNQLNEVRADGIPIHQKTLRDNHDGTYTLSLNVKGESEVDVDATKANIVIVLDISGSMSFPANTAGSASANNSTIGRYGKVDDNYRRLYYSYGGTYYPEGTGPQSTQRHSNVYYASNVNSSGSITWSNNFNGRYNFTNNNTRLDETKLAVKNAIDTLLSKNNNANNITDMVEISLVTFSTYAKYVSPTSATASGWTSGTNGTALKNAVDGTIAVGGTNWDLALYYAKDIADKKNSGTNADGDNTYIIFFSDGEPTYHNGTASSVNNHTHNNTVSDGTNNNQGGGSTESSDINAAYNEAVRIHNTKNSNNVNYKLFSIFAYGTDTGKNYMKNLTSYGNYGDNTHANSVENSLYFSADNQTQINNAFSTIVSAISNDVGIADVKIADGTTAAVSTHSGDSVSGPILDVDATSFKYYLQFEVSGSGTNLTSTVPYITNIAYDATSNTYSLTADNGNVYTGIKRVPVYAVDSHGIENTNSELTNIFRFEWKDANNPLHQIAPPAATYNTTTKQVDWNLDNMDGDATKKDVLLDEITYTVTFDVWPSQVTLDIIADLKNGKITYGDPAYGNLWDYITPDYKLYTNTRATLTYDDTRTEVDESDTPVNYINPDPVNTETVKALNIAKEWENDLDEDEDKDKVKPDSIKLNVNRDTETRYNVLLAASENPDNNWKGSINASIGIMRVNDGTVTVLATGHDYSFAEDQNIAYHWEIKAETVHPMLINGEVNILQLLKEKPSGMTGDYYKDSDNKEYYKVDNKYYVVNNSLGSLTATNYRRSYLEIRKIVDTSNGANKPGETLFWYNVSVTDVNGDEVWFSLEDENGNTIIMPEMDCAREQKVLNMSDSNITDVTPNDDGTISYKYKGSPYTVLAVLDDEGKPALFPALDDDGNEIPGAPKNYKYYTGYGYFNSGSSVNVGMQANWSLRFINLPKDSSYTVTEILTGEHAPLGYEFVSVNDQTDSPVYTGEIADWNTEYLVTYTNKSMLIDIDVTKEWDDNKNQDGIRPDSIEVVLTATDPTTNVTTTKKITLDGIVEYESDGVTVVKNGETASWKATFADLPVYASDGKTKIIYAANETTTDVIKGEDGPGTYAYIVVGTPEDGYTITNQHTPEVRDITVTKVWSDGDNQDGKRPASVNVSLYANGTNVGTEVTLNEGNKWTYTWEDVDKYANGSEITYTVKETETSVITGTDGPGTYAYKVEGSAASGFTVTNTHTPEVRDITVTKVWSDTNNQDGKRPASVNVSLYANGTIVGTEVTLNEENKWTYTWKGVAKYAGTTDEINYTLTETETSVITGTDGPGTYAYKVEGSAASGFTVTNTHTPEVRDITVSKVWSDNDNQDGIRPSNVTVGLYIGTELQGNTVTLSSANEWTYTWENLTKYTGGSEITYTVKEVETSVITGTDGPGTYAYKVEGSAASGFTVTNTHTPEVRDITVTKKWVDGDNQDGIRPGSVSVGLYIGNTQQGESVTLDASNKWTYTWEDITKYADGTEITYAVKETTTSVITGTDGPGTYKFEVTGSASTGFTVTNTHTPEVVTVSGTKTWEDNNNAENSRPSTITVNLLADNVKKASQSVSGPNWTYSWAGLPKYADGEEIKYTVTEDSVSGYKPTINGYNIKNTLDPTAITVTKKWVDANNQDGIRPDNIEVNLIAKYGNTEKVLRHLNLLSTKNWTDSFTNLPQYMEGLSVEYSLTETETSVITGTDGPGTYAYKVEGSASAGFTVTNTHTPEVRDITVTKVWSDANNQDGKRPASVNVSLYANGTIVGTEVTLNEGNKWTYTWEGVAKYAGTTDEINYTLTETETSVITGTDGPGTYAYKVEGSAASGFTVTNTHTPEVRDITVSKVWSDTNNQDGNRPASVNVGLYANGTIVGTEVTLNEGNKWTYTWEDLTKYTGGSEITYTVKETETSVITGTDGPGTYAYKVEGSASAGFTVTNTHTPEVRDITVSKVWDDANNQDGKRPTSVNVGLYANGTIVGAEVTLNEGNKWTYTWEGLTKYTGGSEITYTVKETETSVITGTDGPGTYAYKVEGSASAGFTVTNTHTPEVVTVSGTKTWEDNNNAENSRPSTITVNLLADNVKKASQSVSGPNWTYSWTGLPKYDGGKEIKYTVTEEAVSGYAVSISGYNIKNTLDPTAITVTKKWVDANDQDGIRPDSIEVNLIAKYGDTEKVLRHLSLSNENSWTDSFTNLPQYMNGLPVEYSLTETTTSVITGTDGPRTYKHEITGSASAGFTVTNTHTPEVRDITVSKVWSDANNQDGKRPTSVNVGLYANGTIVGTEITLNEGNKWTYTWEDLTKYNGGSEITYTVKEVETSVITGTDGPGTYAYKVEGSAASGFTVTNAHTPEVRDITVTKKWTDGNNQDGIRPDSVNVGLYANGTIVGTEVTLNEGNKWTYTWEDLTKYNGGSEITYTVKETETSVITGTDGPGTYAYKVEGSAASGFTVTNTHTPEVRDVVVTKVWDDAKNQDGIRPNSITVNLIADGVQRAEKIITEADGWTYTWEDLPKYAGTTDEIVYTLTESTTSVITGTDGAGTYAYKVTGDMNKGFTVTNTHTPEETSVSGTKTWDDAGNQDGKRPESITVNLLADGKVIDSKEVTSADKWAYSWTKLPKYAGTTDAIVYTITEDAVSGYTASIKGFNITNSYTPEKTAVSGKKIWNDKDDQDGKRPLSVTVNLLANGTKVDSATVTETNGWKYSFTDLPKFAGGSEIVYTVTEDAVPGYSTSIDGFTITNSYTPEKTSVSGTKTWSDNNNQDGKRPASITVNLLANGTKVGSKTVTSDDNWKYSFTGLDKYAGGEKINYTVTEENVPGYLSSIDGFNITNTHTIEKTEVSGRKSWADGNNNDNLRPAEITVNLLANGTKVASQTVTSASNWEYSWTGLDKYAGGSEINYTVTEENVPGYTFSLDPDNKYIIVNTHNLNEVSFSVNKVWSDNDNQDGKRLDEVEVKLLGKVGDNVVVEDIQTLNENNKWTYTWTKLKEYDKGSVIAYSVVELTNVPGYSVSYSNSGNDWTITNSHTPEKVNISGTKVWDDTEDNDGIRPDSVTFNLIKNDSKIDSVTIGKADEWKYSWTDLDKYTAGVENIYKVEEENVPEYTTEITKTTATDYVVTNTHTPETISFNITKTWLDADNMDGIRPEKIVVRLLANGSEVANTEITAKNDWKYTFENLKKYAEGVAINYEIVEDPVKGYSTEITKKTDSDYEVTNTATTEITITKTWDDYNDISSIRPDSITVKLYADGNIIKEIIITKEDNWVKVISDLPRYKDGTEISYTITEDPVPEYETSIDGFNITNSYEPGIGGYDPEILPPQTGVHQENVNYNIIFFIMTILNLKYIIFKRYN